MHGRPRPAGGAAREDDQGGRLGIEVDGRGRLGGEDRRVGDGDDRRPVGRVGAAELTQIALVGDHHPRPGEIEPGLQVGGAQLLGARQDDRADAKAGEHRERPLRAVAHERHDDVAGAHALGLKPAGQPGGRVADLRERPLAPAAVAAQLDQGKRIRRRRRDDVAGEVHPIYPRTKGSLVAPVSSIQIDFVSVNDLIASMPFSRPMPLQPNPPNGTA